MVRIEPSLAICKTTQSDADFNLKNETPVNSEARLY